jgi:hypothetical protein
VANKTFQLPQEAQLWPCTPEAKAAGHCWKDPLFSTVEQVKPEYLHKYYPNAPASTPVQQEVTDQGGTSPTTAPSDSGYYVYKEEEATFPVPQAKNLFGGNLDVVASLDKIQFEPYGDGSLRNSIAYIVPWRRGGASAKTQALPSFDGVFETGIQGFLRDAGIDFGSNFSLPDSDLAWPESGAVPELYYNLENPVPLWDENSSKWFDGSININENYGVIDQKGKVYSSTNVDERQKKLGSEIPIGVRQGILTGAQALTGYLTKDNRQIGKYISTGLNQVAGALDTPSGPVYIGNASGVINQALNYASMFGFNIPGRGLTTSIKPDLQSNQSKWTGMNGEGGAPGLPDGAWQFLFNPSELALSVGPKYKETNTWGVMGDANGGQPLHWTNNKNPELKFNRVLLNGYVFGRQVESLEQGLIDLFMKDPSDSSHGPQVLEFVWGQRSFGPCVIKDIQINEKMWDNGLLVNADVSFTLVKVPEWTINDGQVSVYDPTSIDVLVPPEIAPGPVGTGTTLPPEPDSKEKPATGEPPSKKSGQPTKQEIAKKCTNLKNTSSNLEQIQSTYNVLGLYRGDAKQARERLKKYKLMYDLAQLNRIQDINLTIPQGSKTQLGFTGGNFSPARIESGANEQWKKAAGSNPLTDANYPDEYVNNAIGTGVGYLRGSINNQVNSSTCTNAIAQTSQNG